MRSNPISLIAALLLISAGVSAQDSTRHHLYLKSGIIAPVENITTERLDRFNHTASRTSGKSFAVLQFNKLPTAAQRQLLAAHGIELLDYIPDFAYTVSISGNADLLTLQSCGARSLIDLLPTQKMQTSLAKGIIPAWAGGASGMVMCWISFPRSFSAAAVKQQLREKQFEVTSDLYSTYRILAVQTPKERLSELAGLPCIDYVQAIPAPDKLLNSNSMYASGARVLRAPAAGGGLNLDGDGVVVGVGDDGDIQTHIDFTGRLINRTGDVPRAHATHVAGTIGGAGLIQELYAGYAPKSTIIGQLYSNIFTYAQTYVQDHGMVITNNSYGSVADDCDFNGLYDLTARILDQQAFDFPELQHVFAAGNDGSLTCTNYPPGFKTVLGGYQASKNVLTVGSVNYKNDWSGFSSKGPVRDGRIKPEVMAMGEFVASTWVSNQYSYNNGTSMAAPGVSGGLALLVQRYRQLHPGNNPKNGLLKAVLCNGANDRGNTGPDFTYGFGSMNLVRAVRIIENASYFNTTVNPGATNTHTISVPANTARLKVLLYWQDPPAAIMASKTLVNDLDLQVITPANATLLPAILDTLPAHVDQPATSGVDSMNNIEQIVITDPAAGNYDLQAIGRAITQNPSQEYFLVYDIIPKSLVLTDPIGGEALVPTTNVLDTLYVHWDSYSDETNTFTLEFSSDNGSTWSTINNAIPASARTYSWAVPNVTTDVGRIRLSKNNTAFTQTSNVFTITGYLVNNITLSATQCEGYISVDWPAITGATDYEILMMRNGAMVPMGTTNALTYTIGGLSKDTVYWVTVRPRINGHPGRQGYAVSRQPNSGTCAGTISDNDIKLDAILSPASSGRLSTTTALSNAVPVTIRIKNLDDAASTSNITVSYSINGGTPVTELLSGAGASITAGGTLTHSFATTADLSAAGTYVLQVTATKSGDPIAANDSQTQTFRQLTNPSILSSDLPWLDNLEGINTQTVSSKQMGLDGSDRYDFVNSTPYGQLRSFINTGIAYSGSKALTLDMSLYQSGGNTDSLTGTYNLATFNVATDDIRLDFRYKNHGQKTNAANKVWIRGDDTQNWIPVYDLFANQNPADGSYKLSSSIQLADSLSAHSQAFSSSFQVRWGQWGELMAADNETGAGYSFDDIRLYRAIDDIQAISIDTPNSLSCNPGASVPVRVTIRNTSDAIVTNVPVVLKVDGSIVATESIPSIPANDTVHYTFNPGTANLSGGGSHVIQVYVSYASDNVRDNDTTQITVRSLPLITSFPYLQDFESGDGSWYTSSAGFTSWEYGTPLSAKVRRAASGTKAWKTNKNGYYNNNELSYLYSPCFNLSGMTNPTLSFHVALDLEDCGPALCDAAWMEYSTDGGVTWSKLGAYGQGTNWYNKDYSGNQLWSQQDYVRWHVATTALPTSNNSSLRLRFVFASDPGVNKEGIAVDDIHIYDNIHGIYTGTGTGPVVNQAAVSGSGWVDFIESGSNQLIASVNPNGLNMGSTDVQSYVNTGGIRINSDQFYHDRNITIKPATVHLSDSATVRFYFLDSETEALINATGCSYCYKPSMAPELGVSKYSDPSNITRENGTLADNIQGNYIFINPAHIRLVPFDKGYYAEFKVRDFSEFWLSNGGLDLNTPLPVKLLSFTANKKAGTTDVLVSWTTVNESKVDHFEVELAKGNSAYQQNSFVKIASVASQGDATHDQFYQFTDAEQGKAGIRYYRLKMVDKDGSFTYSPVRTVIFSDEIQWQVTPNPSTGRFDLLCQAAPNTQIQVKLYDLGGRLVHQSAVMATGFVQKITIDLGGAKYASGLYLLEAGTAGHTRSFRLVKN